MFPNLWVWGLSCFPWVVLRGQHALIGLKTVPRPITCKMTCVPLRTPPFLVTDG